MKMKTSLFQKTIACALALTIPVVTLAQDKNSKPLDTKNDPTLVGKRDINKGQLSFYGLDREVAIGRQLAAEVDRESKLVTDPIVTEYVNRIAQNIVLHSDAKVPFTVKVIDANEVNAFALPGGFLYVNRGLLEAAENEAEVAGVLAHEIAHVTARHGIEQASKGQLANYASIPLIFFGGIGGYIVQQVAGLAVPLTFLKFSRGAEKEADRLGAQYMWAAGYDPNALITFFEKLQAQEKKKPGTLAKVFSTHPMVGDRIKEARELIVRFPDKNEYQISTSEFGDVRSRLIAASASSRAISAAEDAGRPTLKRRPQTQRSDDDADYSETPDRPVLKRRDSSDTSGSTNSTTGSASSDASDRPVLKRREGATATEPAEKAAEPQTSSSSSDASGRPTLKRRTDQPNQ
jgi:beta-barrel assembly-enhancing protease